MELLKFNNSPTSIQSSQPSTIHSTIGVKEGEISESSGDLTGAVVEGIQINLQVMHTYIGDLKISLASPSGTQVVLMTNSGGEGSDLLNTVFSDFATEYIAEGSAPFGGVYRPKEAFSAFKKENPIGVWTLMIEDTAHNDGGRLEYWGLDIQLSFPEEAYDALLQQNSGVVSGTERVPRLFLNGDLTPIHEIYESNLEAAAKTLDDTFQTQHARVDWPLHILSGIGKITTLAEQENGMLMPEITPAEPATIPMGSISPGNTVLTAEDQLQPDFTLFPDSSVLENPGVSFADVLRSTDALSKRVKENPEAFGNLTLDRDLQLFVSGFQPLSMFRDPLTGQPREPDFIPPEIPAPKAILGLAFSGGGAKGSFEAGVLLYLEWSDILKNVQAVSGTSVGSINALAVSFFQEKAGSKARKLWNGLQKNSDMYQKSQGIRKLEAVLAKEGIEVDFAELMGDSGGIYTGRLMSELTGLGTGTIIASLVFPLAVIGFVFGIKGKMESIAKKAETALKEVDRLYDLTPVRNLLRKILPLPSKKNIPLQIVFVSALDGLIYYVDEHGVAQKISSTLPRRDIGKPVRVQGVDKRDSVIRSALASSSVPFIFGHEFIEFEGSEITHTCWDGGLREVLPLHAVERAGATKIIAVSASPRQIEMDDVKKFGKGKGPAITDSIMRTIDILVDEVAQADRITAKDTDVIFIEPLLGVQKMDQVEQCLIRLNRAYGYMTAFDTLQLPPSNVRKSGLALALFTIVTKGAREEFAALAVQALKLEEKVVKRIGWHYVQGRSRNVVPNSSGWKQKYVAPWKLSELRKYRKLHDSMLQALRSRAYGWGDYSHKDRRRDGPPKGQPPSIPSELHYVMNNFLLSKLKRIAGRPWYKQYVFVDEIMDTVKLDKRIGKIPSRGVVPGWDLVE